MQQTFQLACFGKHKIRPLSACGRESCLLEAIPLSKPAGVVSAPDCFIASLGEGVAPSPSAVADQERALFFFFFHPCKTDGRDRHIYILLSPSVCVVSHNVCAFSGGGSLPPLV